MRKATFLGGALLMGAMAFVASPALAGYEATDTTIDQADHSTFAGIDWVAVGALADENPSYGPGTIVVPYVGIYGFPGCPSNVVDEAGNPIPTTYNCVDDASHDDQDAELIISDIFGQVTEGSVVKVDDAQGIAQYLDNFFAYANDGASPTDGTVDAILINQTLDQDLADLTMGLSTDTHALGIWQQLHTAFSFTATDYNAAADSATTDADGIDQTMEAFMQEDAGGTAPGGYVISYSAQWFQKGSNQDCSGTLCTHDEFGGHTAVDGTPYDAAAAATAHDP